MRRATIATGLVLLLVACGGADGSAPATTPTTTTEPAVIDRRKVADALIQAADQVAAARSRHASGREIEGLSTGIVRVRADGAIEVELHGGEAVTPEVLQQLRRIGAEVTGTSATPPAPGQPTPTGVVQAWVPADRLPDVSRLAWVAAVTPPAYPELDSGG